MPPLSILDLAFVPEGGTPADALRSQSKSAAASLRKRAAVKYRQTRSCKSSYGEGEARLYL